MRAIVDTNVLIVAKGRDTHADLACQSRCVDVVQDVSRNGTVVIDDRNLILDEYQRHLSFKGQPSVGDAFFKHVYDNQYSTQRVERVSITPVNEEERVFEKLPSNTLDPSDQKFLAVSVVSKAPILNATDSDWYNKRALILSLAVEVKQLCPQHATQDNQNEPLQA